MTLWPGLVLLLAALPATAVELDCPLGQTRVQTENPYEPFKCVDKAQKAHGLKGIVGPKGFGVRPKCPRGSRPVMTPGKMQAYRCVMSQETPAEPDLKPALEGNGFSPYLTPEKSTLQPVKAGSCPPGQKKVRTDDPLEPTRCVDAKPKKTEVQAGAFRRYTIPGEISFDYPKAWHLTDGWRDEPPTVYVVFDPGRGGGKQVTLVVTRLEQGQPGFQDMRSAMIKEKEWQGAQDGGEASAAGLQGRFLQVPGESKTAYLASGDDRYFTLSFSSPAELYGSYEPVYQRLLKTFRLGEQP